MRYLLAFLMALALLAQDTTGARKDEKKTEPPAPTVEKPLDGFLEVGFRWLGRVGGDFNTYRSVVNTAEGLRVSAAELNFVKPDSKLADEIHLSLSNWGDPFNTARMDAGKQGIYRYRGSYSNTNYFNVLPSFANPGLSQGLYFSQRAYDTAMRNYDNELEFLPGRRFVPYVGFLRNSSFGSGVTPLVVNNNEYPLRNNVKWEQYNVFGGVRAELSRFHATFEGGKTSFRDDQSVESSEPLNGNRPNPYLGRRLLLNNGLETYGIRGDGPYYKALFTSNPAAWIDLFGQFYYTRPDTASNYSQIVNGNFVTLPGILFYQSGRDQFFGNASMPRTSGALGAEIRPLTRLRFRLNYEAGSFHSDTTGRLQTALTTAADPTTPVTGTEASTGYLKVTNNRATAEVFYDVSRRLLLRGGYRHDSGQADVRAGQVNPSGSPLETGKTERLVGLGGIQYRPLDKLTLNVDLEKGDGRKTFYRTGLLDYWKVRTQARYQALTNLHINALFNVLDNNNNSAGVGLAFRAQQASLGVHWMPKGGKFLSILGEYTRSSITSDIDYLVPASLQPARSLYRDNGNTFTGLLDLRVKGARLTTGGSFITTSGSRPSRYYQPTGRFSVPLHRHVQAFSEWRYFGLRQPFYIYEGFSNHQILTGLRFVM